MIVRRVQKGEGESAPRKMPRGAADLHEDYQTLLRRVHSCVDGSNGAARAIGVTSCSRHAGVSTVAGNLAVAEALASPGKTLLVDANLTRPFVHRRFGVPLAPGLMNAARGEIAAADCCLHSEVANLHLVTAGTAHSQIEPCCRRADMMELLDGFKREYRTVIVDLPAVGGGGSPLAGAMDGLILVVEAERTDSRTALYAKQQLLEVNANILGVVLNKRRLHIPGWLYRIL